MTGPGEPAAAGPGEIASTASEEPVGMGPAGTEFAGTESAGTGEVLRRLDELTDLFRRRLQDDRDKRRLIEKLDERLSQAESGPFRQYLHPFVNGLALVLDRLDRYAGPDPEFIASIRAELLQLLSLHGVTEVPVSGAFDPSRHEAVGVREAPGTPPGTVLEVYSRGLAHGPWVFRPARVVVSAAPPETREARP